jgi:hypothetical protein
MTDYLEKYNCEMTSTCFFFFFFFFFLKKITQHFLTDIQKEEEQG